MSTKTLSIEDRNLQGGVRITSVGQKRYSDIDLSFMKKKNGDIFKKTDASSVKQSIKNLLLTNYYEKPFQPYFGANIQGMLFELNDDFIESDVQEEIRKAIEIYEPRAKLIDVIARFNESQNSLNVQVIFQIVNTNEIATIETEISRLR